VKYLISYDLEQPPAKRDYAPLEARLAQIGARRVLYSEWIVDTPLTHTQLRDDLKKLLLPHDRILVVAITAPAAWGNLQVPDDEFLRFFQS